MARIARRQVGLLAVAALAGLGFLGSYPERLAEGDAAWERRAEGEEQGRPRIGPIRDAVRAYTAALRSRPDSLEARWKLLRALHFAGEFAAEGEEQAGGFFDRALAVSEEGLDLLAQEVGAGVRLDEMDGDQIGARIDATIVSRSDVARLYFWSAINWGSWSRVVGPLAAVRKGVANRLQRYTSVTIALEPGYDEGGAFRLLGRLHAELPRVPFVSGWVERGRAIPLVERAYAMAPENPGNRLLLALTLLDLAPERRPEALELLAQVESLEPRPSMRVEDLAMRREARERLSTSRAGAASSVSSPSPRGRAS